MRAAGERLDVQRLRVLPVDPVADAAQPREVAQVLLLRRVCWSPARSYVAPELPSGRGSALAGFDVGGHSGEYVHGCLVFLG